MVIRHKMLAYLQGRSDRICLIWGWKKKSGTNPKLFISATRRILCSLLPREGNTTHSSILGKFHEQRRLASYSPWGYKRVRHNLATKQQQQQDEEDWEKKWRSSFVYVKFEMPIRDLRRDVKKTIEIQVWISVKIYGWNNKFGSHHHLCGI